MAEVAGVDGCKSGWIAVVVAEPGPASARIVTAPDFAALMETLAACAAVVVDMPIGLAAGPGGRMVEGLARQRIKPRHNSVFTPPVRATLAAASYAEARTLNLAASGKSLSAQAHGILPRIREIDGWITPERQARVVEGHPELAFATLAGRPLAHYKKTAEGRADRASLLMRAGFDVPALDAARPKGAAPDDLLDACILAHAARRVASGTALRLPEEPGRDARGLRMEMWA